MPSFRGIEGARAWLAWIVVVTHVIALTGVAQALPGLGHIRPAGDWAVQLFIIISGFVIAHLLLTRREPYPLYIGRRALRLFPAYLVSLALAIAVLPSTITAFNALPWHDPALAAHLGEQYAQLQNGQSGWHIALHALMLHGVVPNTVLPESEYMFLTPAWSVSLEWQFYLVAPIVIAMLLDERLKIVLLLTAAASYAAYRFGLFGHFYLPSFLPGAIGYFMVGIGTRMAVDRLPTLERYPLALVCGCMILSIGAEALVPVAAWIALMSYALLGERALANPDNVTRALRLLLDSAPIVAAGARSYSVYILHWVIISVMLCIAVLPPIAESPWLQVSVVLTGALLFTALGSECLYRLVEKPAIAFGKRLARQSDARSAASQHLHLKKS